MQQAQSAPAADTAEQGFSVEERSARSNFVLRAKGGHARAVESHLEAEVHSSLTPKALPQSGVIGDHQSKGELDRRLPWPCEDAEFRPLVRPVRRARKVPHPRAGVPLPIRFVRACSWLFCALWCVACSAAGAGEEPPPPVAACTNIPSFETEIYPALLEHCSPCHGPAGPHVADFQLSESNVRTQRFDIRTLVEAGKMPPPADAPPLPPQVVAKLAEWIDCGAPGN